MKFSELKWCIVTDNSKHSQLLTYAGEYTARVWETTQGFEIIVYNRNHATTRLLEIGLSMLELRCYLTQLTPKGKP